KGFGGLPVGIEGKVVALIEDDDSIKAAKRVMRRGCDLFPVGFKEKNVDSLQKYSPKKLIFEKIKNIKNIEELAQKNNSKAVVVNQTLKNFKEIKTNLLILRPLIAE
ncbi:hypothetical protein GOV08_04090, partial [Candidatus Woesearchaeota archaeon]|nr:hypothetical protein [Candidatus Woesearchaeota archaeon]